MPFSICFLSQQDWTRAPPATGGNWVSVPSAQCPDPPLTGRGFSVPTHSAHLQCQVPTPVPSAHLSAHQVPSAHFQCPVPSHPTYSLGGVLSNPAFFTSLRCLNTSFQDLKIWDFSIFFGFFHFFEIVPQTEFSNVPFGCMHPLQALFSKIFEFLRRNKIIFTALLFLTDKNSQSYIWLKKNKKTEFWPSLEL